MAHILVVDDEPSIRALIKTILQHEGHHIETAANGAEALDIVLASIPDLIVLDLMMPEMDGWRLLEELHARDLRRHTRVVIVSGHIDSYRDGSTTHARERHLLPKPFEPSDLVLLVDDALSRDADELFTRRDRTVNLARLIDRIDGLLGQ
jgi:CheY-like chemotaxis protein